MTVQTTTARTITTGNDVTTTFNTDFEFFEETTLVVTIVTTATGAESVKVLTTDYTVSGGDGSTGSITFVSIVPASTEQVVIERVQPYTQGIDFQRNDPFPSETNEKGLDRLTHQTQQLLDVSLLSVLAPITRPTSSASLQIEEPVSGEFLRGKSDLSGWEHASITASGTIGIPVSIAEGGTGSITAAAALTALVAAGTAIANTFTDIQTFSAQTRWAKGSDIASASPLVLGTDGNYFDVTGTTGFSAVTVAAGTLFMLQFDGALTLTHGAPLDLPGEGDITTAAGDRLIGFAEAADTVQVLSYVKADGSPVVGGKVVQQVFAEDATYASTTTVVPDDDTIPQNTEGAEAETVTITPTNANNILVIEAGGNFGRSAAAVASTLALFQDATANALAAAQIGHENTPYMQHGVLHHRMIAGTTSATTFKLRFGPSTAGTAYRNGDNSARRHGGILTSFIKITEYAA